MVKTKPDIKDAVLLLRYRTTTPISEYPAFYSYAKIARAIGVSYNKVQHECRHYFKKKA